MVEPGPGQSVHHNISACGDPSVFCRSMSSAQVMGMAATENVYSVVDHLPRSSKLLTTIFNLYLYIISKTFYNYF